MNTELKNAVKATDKDAQYDTSAKRLLGQKSILAHILVKTVDEFKGMNPKDVVDCIEGTPHISTVPVEPGLTNAASEKNGERLVGFNTENEEINEGLVRFDLGSYEWKGNLDLLNIIMLGLAKNLPEHDETYELHRLLGALLSKELTIDEKLNIIGNEYDIPIEENFRKDVSVMCNLSQGIEEKGIAIGRAEGEAGLIIKMYKNGFTAEQIASATDKDIEEVKAIIAGKEPALA